MKSNLLLGLACLCSLLLSHNSFSQEKVITVSGMVADSARGSMNGVNVQLKGTRQGTVTDENGRYSLKGVPVTGILVFSFIGYSDKEVPINSRQSINITLRETNQNLEDVVVIGYGVQKRSHFAGASVRFDAEKEKVDQIPVERIDKALQGKVAGVQIRDVGGEVGQSPEISIRGNASFSASNTPLIVVDGMPISGDLSDVATNDIATLDILKDAASTAIYGSRGANGVILITTKKGKNLKPQFNIKANAGMSEVGKFYDTYTNYEEFARNEYRKLIAPWESDFLRAGLPVPAGTDANGVPVKSPGNRTYLSWENYFTNRLNPATDKVYDANGAGYYNINRLNQISNPESPQESITNTAYRKAASASARGGNGSVGYFLSLNYENTDGVMIKNNFKGYSFTANLNARINKKLNVELNLMPRFKRTQLAANAQMGGGLRWITIPLYHDENSLKTVLTTAEGGALQVGAAPGSFVKSRDFRAMWLMNDDYSDFVRNAAGAKIKVSSYSHTGGTTSFSDATESDDIRNEYGLTGNFAINWDIIKGLRLRSTLGTFTKYNARDNWVGSFKNSAGQFNEGYGTLVLYNGLYRNVINENTLTYNKDFNQHSINVLAGFSNENSVNTTSQEGGRFFLNDDIRTMNNAGEIVSTQVLNNKVDEKLVSFFGRINYSYGDRYILSMVMRKDGSSKFGPANRWGSFPSVSAAWRISQEGFMKNVNAVSDLRLRVSYGVTGNNKIPAYSFVTAINRVNYIFDGTTTGGFAPTSSVLGNPSIGWEQTNATNVGLSASFLKNRINLNIDMYSNKTQSLLLENPIVNITGYNSEWANIGQVQNRGIEIEVNTINIKSKNFTWSTAGNFSRTKNKLLDYGGAEEQFFAGYQNSAYRMKVGRPLGEFYGYKTTGELWKTTAEIQTAVSKGLAYAGTVPGDQKLMDTDGDGVITENDKTSLGDVYPDFEWGISNQFTYKNFDAGFMFQGSHGSQVWNMSNLYGLRYLKWINEDSFIDEFHGNTALATSTSVSGTDMFVEDASFIVMRDVSLGYTLRKQRIRVFFSGRNLLYFMAKGYRGVNPEYMDNISGNLIKGEQRVSTTAYLRSFQVGLDIKF